MRLVRPVIASLFMIAALSSAACSGCPGAQPAECDACPDGQECVDGQCRGGDAGHTVSSSSGGLGTWCETDAECREDELCNTLGNLCVSRHDCDTAEDCRTGQECRDFDGDGYRDCGYPGCNSDAECETELAGCDPGERARCIARACECKPACGGDCGTGKVCCGVAAASCGGRDACCVDDVGPCAALTCNPGYEAISENEAPWSVDLCDYTNASCKCNELPPLPMGVVGQWNAIALDGTNRLWVAAYNGEYGDLLVGRYDSSISDVDWEFVDGVPLGAPVVAGPSGPRGGVADPGPDTGRYVDLAVTSAGVAHVVYQDVSSSYLRYARLDDAGNVTRITLDVEGETGIYPSIALDPSNNAPRIAWLTRRLDSAGTPVSRLKLAAAHDATPGAASDFVVHTLSEVDLTTIACEGGCPEGSKCYEPTNPNVLPACRAVADTCSPSCAMGEFCSTGGCLPEYPGSANRDVPKGPGVWSTIVVRPDGKPVVLVYDSFAKDLAAYTTRGGDPPDSPSAGFDSVIIDGAGVDTGLWPSAAVDSSSVLHVAYINATTHALVHVELGASLTETGRDTIDDAARTNGQSSDLHRLAEPALVVRTDGTIVVAYQDGTTGELLMASETGPGTYTRTTVAGGLTGQDFDGYFGFSNDVAGRGSSAPVISTFKRYLDTLPHGDALVLFNVP